MNEVVIPAYSWIIGIVATAVGGSLIGWAWGYAMAGAKWKKKRDDVLRYHVTTCEAYHTMWLQYLVLREGAKSVLKWLDTVQPQQIPPQHAIDIFVEELQEPREIGGKK